MPEFLASIHPVFVCIIVCAAKIVEIYTPSGRETRFSSESPYPHCIGDVTLDGVRSSLNKPKLQS